MAPGFDLSRAFDCLNQLGGKIRALELDDTAGLQRILADIVAGIGDLLPGSSAAVGLLDEGQERFIFPAGAATGPVSLQIFGQPAALPVSQCEVLPVLPSGETPVRFPLQMAGQVLGVLVVAFQVPPGGEAGQDLRQQEAITLLESFAYHSAVALSLARQSAVLQQEQLRKDKELRRLRRAGMLISSRTSLQETFQAILRMSLEVTDAIYGMVRLVDTSGKNLVMRAIAGENLVKPGVELLPIAENSIMGYVAARREPIVIADLRAEPWSKIYVPFDLDLEMRSEVAVPLVGASGRLEGVINLESPAVNAFTKQDRYLLQILATQAVVAIQEARLLDALQAIIAHLSTHSVQDIHQLLVEQAGNLLNVPTSLIWLVEKEYLVLQAAPDPALRGTRIPLDGGYNGQAVRTCLPVSVLDACCDPQYIGTGLDSLNGNGSVLIVPILTGTDDRPVGLFSVYTANGETRDFGQSDWDIKVLTILGHYAALAAQNAARLEELRLAQEQRATTETFAAIGDIAANLMHRLNNKIGTIPVRVEGIQDKSVRALASDPYLANNLEEIQRSASDAMEIVRESLFHLRPIQLAPVSVLSAVNDAIRDVRLPRSIWLDSQGLEDLPPVQAGAQRLTLVFSNLLDNANDAMGGRGMIHIEGTRQGKWVEVRVSDNGPGIPAELQERIFEFNFSANQQSGGRRPLHPGKLGFGLWWVKSLMARFGGSVVVESDGRSGTTFVLHLPVSSGGGA
jgi:signal transduction histidine kinase